MAPQHSTSQQDDIAKEEERFNAVVEEKAPAILEDSDEEAADLDDAAYFGDLVPFCDPGLLLQLYNNAV